MGGRVKCLVRCARRKKLPRFLKPLLLKIVGDVVRSRPLPHSLVLVVKNRRSLAPRPGQDAEEVIQISPADKHPQTPTVRGAFQLQAKTAEHGPRRSSEEPPGFQQIGLSTV